MTKKRIGSREPGIRVLIAGTGAGTSRLLAQVNDAGYDGEICGDLEELQAALEKSGCRAVILDLDSLSLDNRTVGRLAGEYPDVCFLCSSSKTYHPHLQEAIRRYFYACLSKPVDPDELRYWLKCAGEDGDGDPAAPVRGGFSTS